jgi:hypothetical protein
MSDRQNPWMPGIAVEDACEKYAFEFLKSKGINATKVKRREYPTPDYEWDDVGIEVTTVHFSDPLSDPELRKLVVNNPCNYYYGIYGYSEDGVVKPICKTITKKAIEYQSEITQEKQIIIIIHTISKVSDSIDVRHTNILDIQTMEINIVQ